MAPPSLTPMPGLPTACPDGGTWRADATAADRSVGSVAQTAVVPWFHGLPTVTVAELR